MRISVVHGYYSSRVPSGENVVVDLQVAALRDAGHEVHVIGRRQDEEERVPFYALRAASRVATGRGGDPSAELAAFGPDIVHVHNLFPNFGRRWVERFGQRLVATVHNYRPICPAGTLFRDGHGCTECPDADSALPAVRHGCFKDSRLATLPMLPATRFAKDPLLRSAARVVTLSDDMRLRYAALGVDEHRLVTVPNFTLAPERIRGGPGGAWLYVGRLTEEKGILPLVQAWPERHRLRIVGGGPLENAVRNTAPSSVTTVGELDHDAVLEALRTARGLVFPSRWPEGLPTVYLEALATGVPVLARPESVVGRLVRDSGTGAVMTDDLGDDLDRAADLFPELGAHCRRVFEQHYTRDAWLRNIETVYADVRRITHA